MLKMYPRHFSCILAFILLVLMSMEATFVQANSSSNPRSLDPAITHYDLLSSTKKGQERVKCLARGACNNRILTCPEQCSVRKPEHNRKQKGCFIDCSSKCEVTCKWRKANCEGYGSLCYDPRFVGGDGVMFYFHGAKGGNFAIVSDNNLQINAHFIGSRPEGRTRDFTWVQALAVMFDTHTIVIAANRVANWDDEVDSLSIRFDGNLIEIPAEGATDWTANRGGRTVIVERTDKTNNAKVTVAGLVEITVKVRAIGEEEDRVHNYQLPTGDAFAHLETQFKFGGLTDQVEGVLGKTYRPGYVSTVKRGVPMPIMGGEDKYETPSFLAPVCKVCRFQTQASAAAVAVI